MRDPVFDYDWKFNICNIIIRASKVLKYLGVMVDVQGSFEAHFAYLEKKCRKSLQAFHAIFHNTRDYDNRARRVMLDSVVSVIQVLLHCLCTPAPPKESD